MNNPLLKNVLLSLLSVTLLASCTSVTQEVRVTIEQAFKEPKDVTLTQQQIADFPYTALYVRNGDAPRILTVLGYKEEPDDWHFITAEKETLVLRNGRIIRTQGLSDDILATSQLEQDPLNCIVTQPDTCDKHWQRSVEFQRENNVVSRAVNSVFSDEGDETITLPLGERTLRKVIEKGRFLLSDEEFINTFWVARDGHVVKSRQKLLPGGQFVEVIQVKWFGRDAGEAE